MFSTIRNLLMVLNGSVFMIFRIYFLHILLELKAQKYSYIIIHAASLKPIMPNSVNRLSRILQIENEKQCTATVIFTSSH